MSCRNKAFKLKYIVGYGLWQNFGHSNVRKAYIGAGPEINYLLLIVVEFGTVE